MRHQDPSSSAPLVGVQGGCRMSQVDFKKCHCRVSLSLIIMNVTSRTQRQPMSHVAVSILRVDTNNIYVQ